MQPVRVMLLDDHPLILDGLAGFLGGQDDVEIVGRYTDETTAREALAQLKPDVAIVDVKVQGGYTFDLCAGALERDPDLKFVYITGHDDDVFLERAFQVGALGYVLKSEAPSVLLEAIRCVTTGERYLSPQLLARFPNLARDPENVTTRLASLTKREREILKLVSKGMSAKEISTALKISTWTVTNHKANIMAKLDIHNQVGLTRFAVSTGLASL